MRRCPFGVNIDRSLSYSPVKPLRSIPAGLIFGEPSGDAGMCLRNRFASAPAGDDSSRVGPRATVTSRRCSRSVLKSIRP